MEYAYVKLMKDNNLTLNDLNEDAINGIDSIKQVEKSIAMLAKRGKGVSAKVMSKVKSNDKWICGEILEILDGKHRNNYNEVPFKEEEIIEQIQEEIKEHEKSEIDETNVSDPIGIAIDVDFENAYNSGKHTMTLDELKSISRRAYDVIFNAYEPENKNGIETSFYLLLEKEKHTFTLTKK
jgi:hypothetical protein